jgi:hypothetical protein
MKLSKLAFAAAIAWGIYAGNASAQMPGHTGGVLPTSFANEYYYQPADPASPSDQAAAAAPVVPVAPAAAPCTTCEAPACEECEPWHLFCQKECGWNFYGWANGGIMANAHNPQDHFNGPVTFADRDYGQFNQLYGVLENTIDTGGCGWDIGGRVDVLFGSDYFFTQAVGLELHDDGTAHWNQNAAGFGSEYGLALPQFYAEIGYNDLSVKLGHFYTVIGYEVVPATGNFFYTHAYTMQYGEPFTHTGALATYKYSDSTTLVGGIVNGWDNFDREVDTGAALFGFAWADEDAGRSLAWNMILSPNETNFYGAQTNRNMYSLVFQQTWGCDDEWQYVFQHDYGWQHNGNPTTPLLAAEWYGINQYLFYTINDCWKAGLRFEWFRDDDGARVTGLRNQNNAIFLDGFAGNFFELSAGLNWTPHTNWIIRPEIRYDWFDGVKVADGGFGPVSTGPFRGGTGVDQLLFGFDVIVTF